MDFPVFVIPPETYPRALREVPRPPRHLYYRGVPLTERRTVAVIGTRRPSAYGTAVCEKIILDLAGYPVTIVSGLTPGIDSVAHTAALEAGLAVAVVVSSGLDDSVLSPRFNIRLAHTILSRNGTLLSEFGSMVQGTTHTSLFCNRLIAGLSDIVVVVECETKSGSRVIAGLAAEYGKDVGAVPHSIFSRTGAGTNALIRQGAHIIRSGYDIISILGLDEVSGGIPSLVTLTREERIVHRVLAEPRTREDLSDETNLSPQMLDSVLVSLEMKSLITESLGRFMRT